MSKKERLAFTLGQIAKMEALMKIAPRQDRKILRNFLARASEDLAILASKP